MLSLGAHFPYRETPMIIELNFKGIKLREKNVSLLNNLEKRILQK